ncbi:MAG: hypothetical protein ABW039_13160 [Sphingobium sp.]
MSEQGYVPETRGGLCGCIAALPVILLMLVIFTGSVMGDCFDDDACRASKNSAMWWA